jgi:methyltransferase (TIGR00027 family)
MSQLSSGADVLGETARWTAAVRAQETQREDALVRDPWAAALAGEEGQAWLAARPPGSTTPIVLRTRYFDDFLARATAAGLRQVVLLAAGLDTRAYRLPWPQGTILYEIDQAPVLRHKEAILAAADAQPTCERHTVAADLTEPWAAKLVAAGFRSQEPACYLAEGFLFYLPTEQVAQILDAAARWAAWGSWLGFDIINSLMLTSPITRPWIDMQAQAGAPWVGVLDDPVAFLAARGWEASLSQAGEPDAHHGRWALPVIPVTRPDMPHNWFVTAQKRG